MGSILAPGHIRWTLAARCALLAALAAVLPTDQARSAAGDEPTTVLALTAARLAGLRDAQGRPHPMPPPHPVTGRTLDVTQFGADRADSDADDRPAIEAALLAAREGDEVYFPDGVYNLRSASPRDEHTHILLKSRVNLRGQSMQGVRLVSSFDVGSTSRPYTVIRGQDVSDLTLSHLTVTSTWQRSPPTDPRVTHAERGGPLYAVAIEGKDGTNRRVTIDSITVERYARMGVRVGKGSSEIVIRRSVARQATDIGGGGAGYGFVLQGAGHATADENPFLGTRNDTFLNLIEDCVVEGPAMRHGVLIQYWAHHNLVRNCRLERVVYDAIDLHGEDEYLNEIAHNVIVDTSAGAGIGLGNSGATHDRTGPGNWIHHNTISRSMRGITVEFGTRDALIEDNVFQGNHMYAQQFGIGLGSSRGIVIRRNRIIDSTAPGFAAIAFFANRAVGREPAGVPSSARVEANIIHGNTGERARALRIDAQGPCNVFLDNQASGNTDNDISPTTGDCPGDGGSGRRY